MNWTDLEALVTGEHLDGRTLRSTVLNDSRLGQILTRHAVVTDTELESALDIQRQAGGLLGEILVQLGYCTPTQISWALGCQYAETRLGQLLLRNRAIEIEHLRAAYTLLRAGAGETLPEVLVQEGFVSADKLTAIMEEQYQEAKLGQILLLFGVLTEEQLAKGLTRQGQTGERLGEALRELGFAKDEDIERALQEQARG